MALSRSLYMLQQHGLVWLVATSERRMPLKLGFICSWISTAMAEIPAQAEPGAASRPGFWIKRESRQRTNALLNFWQCPAVASRSRDQKPDITCPNLLRGTATSDINDFLTKNANSVARKLNQGYYCKRSCSSLNLINSLSPSFEYSVELRLPNRTWSLAKSELRPEASADETDQLGDFAAIDNQGSFQP